ncbi:hypothetical protein FEE96_01055 [Parasedimentitalea maritima]|uniref:Uncharacterized protein n=1 Tax=Parasedimentitalea maritima TaxID=2578117 RepID=A0ABY2V052_9RHOB|nr:DUF6258 family protein [Zongyanglinia marina]TLP68906.1 hypothetical protein FEE96_01055 [Zongyanglinia marina]
MDVQQFVSSIYLGDRGCMGVVFDKEANEVRIEVDCISRLAPGTKTWNFYNDENVENGAIVFRGVTQFFRPENGWLPNDYINYLELVSEQDGVYHFRFSGDLVADEGETRAEVVLDIYARSIDIEG